MRRSLILALAILIPAACGSGAPAAAPARTAAPAVPSPTAAPVAAPYDIATAGRIRVAMFSNDAGLIAKDPATGELSGASVDIARELARRLGVSLSVVDVTTYPAMSAALKAGTADMVLVALTPEREADLDFTQPLIETDLTYLAPSGAAFTSAGQVDKPGVRIAVRKGTPSEAALAQTVRQAQLIRIDGTLDDALATMRGGGADLVAGARSNLLSLKTKLPGAAVLPERFGVMQWALAVPKGKQDLLRPVAQFAKEIMNSEFVTVALIRSGGIGVQAAVP